MQDWQVEEKILALSTCKSSSVAAKKVKFKYTLCFTAIMARCTHGVLLIILTKLCFKARLLHRVEDLPDNSTKIRIVKTSISSRTRILSHPYCVCSSCSYMLNYCSGSRFIFGFALLNILLYIILEAPSFSCRNQVVLQATADVCTQKKTQIEGLWHSQYVN